MPPTATRIPSPCRVVNFSTAFLRLLKEYLPIEPLSLKDRVTMASKPA
jgi:hypothetical protein